MRYPATESKYYPDWELADIEQSQKKVLERRFPYKFFHMWTHRKELIHPLSLGAYKKLIEDIDGLAYKADSRMDQKYGEFIKSWPQFSEKLVKIIPEKERGEDFCEDFSRFLSILMLSKGESASSLDLLLAKKAVILYGPPGTGKTWIAKRLAGKLLGLDENSGQYESEMNTLKYDPALAGRNAGDEYAGGAWQIIQFHPGYAYEDFIGGIAPALDGQSVKYRLKSGVFKKFCDFARAQNEDLLKKAAAQRSVAFPSDSRTDAPAFAESAGWLADCSISEVNGSAPRDMAVKAAPESQNSADGFIDSGNDNQENKRNSPELSNFVFIIDEINRANLSAVFGELLYALEYRGEGVDIPSFNEKFVIPENVYIIGTMNNVDKSLETFDLALRRRFGFKKIMPDMEILATILGKRGVLPEVIEKYQNRCRELNERICQDGEFGLSDDYQIGHAYFGGIIDLLADPESGEIDIWALERLWSYFLEPLLEEYLGRRAADGEYREKLNELKKFFTYPL